MRARLVRLVFTLTLSVGGAAACDGLLPGGDAPSAASSPGASLTPASGEAAGNGASNGSEAAKAETAPPAWLEAALEDPPPLRLPEAKQLPAADAGACPEKRRRGPGREVGVMTSPRVPSVGAEMRIWAADLASEAALAMRVESADGAPVDVKPESFDGVPSRAMARWTPSAPGKYRVIVGRDGEGLRCREFWVAKYARPVEAPEPELERVWKPRGRWNAAEEALYSAWLLELFEGPPGEDLAWPALHEVTADPQRNLLFDHEGWEDSSDFALELTPDCADLPYFLRAYYSWKRRLPFGFHTCSRGSSDRAPRCFSSWAVNEKPDLSPKWTREEEPFTQGDVMQRFFSRTLAWGVHTGNGRCALEDEENDLYPVALSRESLRPGTIYADPYGHILVLTQFVPPREGRPGILYAVDGQPDASITRKRFWEGNFLWNPDPKLGGSGFKAFRPFEWVEEEVEVEVEVAAPAAAGAAGAAGTEGGASNAGAPATEPPAGKTDTRVELREVLRPLDDAALERKRGYGNLATDAGKLESDAFYDRVEAIISPGTRDPLLALREAVDALAEAARIRVTSVDNAQRYLAQRPGEVIEMPWGHAIFETTGAWENYSTPARDLRLLLAIDVVRNYEGKIRRNPEAFALGGASLEVVLERVGALRERLVRDPRYAITYTRSDGSAWTVGLDELLRRAEAFEAAYNPNECPERRWGAAPGSEEMKTCKRRAPEPQRKMVAAYRGWFAERKRPGRGEPGPDVPGVERPPEDED